MKPAFAALDPFCQPGGSGEWNGIKSAIGCIPMDSSKSFIAWILPFLMGIAGGISLLLMIKGAIEITTSGGNPQKIQAGRETITSAVIGLLTVIFSLFLLKVIGVDILRIPGL